MISLVRMFYCPKCNKEITICPNCKQRITDTTALLYYQLATLCIFVAAVFFLLKLELQEKTESAMKPFKEAAEIAEKKAKIVSVNLPKPDKKKKSTKKTSRPKKSPIRGQTADFRAALWGTPRSRIVAEEKSELIDDKSAYHLDYLDTINNLDTIVRYTFSSSRLISGHYIFLGEKCRNLEQVDQINLKKIGESTPKEIRNMFSFFPEIRNKSISELASIEQLYYEMLTSLMAQLGDPLETSLRELEGQYLYRLKVASVIVFDRAISYHWETEKSLIDLDFAAHENAFYLCVSYSHRKASR